MHSSPPPTHPPTPPHDRGRTDTPPPHHHHHQQKRHRGGYDAGAGLLLRKQGTVSAFVETEDPVAMLSEHSELTFGAGCVDF